MSETKPAESNNLIAVIVTGVILVLLLLAIIILLIYFYKQVVFLTKFVYNCMKVPPKKYKQTITPSDTHTTLQVKTIDKIGNVDIDHQEIKGFYKITAFWILNNKYSIDDAKKYFDIFEKEEEDCDKKELEENYKIINLISYFHEDKTRIIGLPNSISTASRFDFKGVIFIKLIEDPNIGSEPSYYKFDDVIDLNKQFNESTDDEEFDFED